MRYALAVFAILLTLLAAEPSKLAVDLTPSVSELLSIPYVNDEVRDETGRWTFFEHPETTAAGPGLNCSGFVVTAARQLLHRAPTLAEATRDRLGDSGADASFGKDWDFGFDLVMNLSEGLERAVVTAAKDEPVDERDGRALRGFRFDDAAAWQQVLARLRVGRVYLASLNRNHGKGVQHHHVAFLLRDAANAVWFYQTLPKGRSHRIEVTSAQGYARLQKMFGAGIRVLLIEVTPPRE